MVGDDFFLLIDISSLGSGVTFRIVVSGLCILKEDFDAFKFEKKDLDGSRPCLGVCPGEVGKGGIEVKVGEVGEEGETDGFLKTG